MAETTETKVERSDFKVLKPFVNQRRELAAGDTVALRPDQAQWLQEEGYVEPVTPAPAGPEKGKVKNAGA